MLTESETNDDERAVVILHVTAADGGPRQASLRQHGGNQQHQLRLQQRGQTPFERSLGKNLYSTIGVRFDQHSQDLDEDSERVSLAYFSNALGATFKSSYGTGIKFPSLYRVFLVLNVLLKVFEFFEVFEDFEVQVNIRWMLRAPDLGYVPRCLPTLRRMRGVYVTLVVSLVFVNLDVVELVNMELVERVVRVVDHG